MTSFLFSLLVVFSIADNSMAAPKLDRPYPNLQHPVQDLKLFDQRTLDLPLRSDLQEMLKHVTPIKNQDNRGTCSIFSATSLLESMMILSGKADGTIDLSEEWLQYLTTLKVSEEGSDSPSNFRWLQQYGQPLEKEMPYVGTEWKSKSTGLAAKRCGHLPRGKQLRSCLISHRDPGLMALSNEEILDPANTLYDPEFVNARESAKNFRDLLFDSQKSNGRLVKSVIEIHRLISQGIPLTLEFDFYYGSWNHPEATKLGINRSPALWKQGAVTYPEKDSTDLAYSKRSESGHSVMVVGYDDEREITYWVESTEGHRRKVTRKGVYYFKNSWGPSQPGDWGSEFEIDGIHYSGYGMILQDHAHEYGQFFQLLLK